MPEYTAPGVYVEETSFRGKPIEGVATSIAGFAGMARTGPVFYNHGAVGNDGMGPANCTPRLISSWGEFEEVYGGLEPLRVGVKPGTERTAYLARAIRAFFDNGGRSVYVSRVYAPRSSTGRWDGVARREFSVGLSSTATWRARWPGAGGNLSVETAVRRSRNLVSDDSGAMSLQRASSGLVVEHTASGNPLPDGVELANLCVVEVTENETQTLHNSDGGTTALEPGDVVRAIELDLAITGGSNRDESYTGLSTAESLKTSIGRVLAKARPRDGNARVWLDLSGVADEHKKSRFWPAALMLAMIQSGSGELSGGHDGNLVQPDDLMGHAAQPENLVQATGLEALAEIDDIAIVALPDGSTYESAGTCTQAMAQLIAHVESLRHRIAIIDGPRGSSASDIRAFRGNFDSTRAALYHPWCEVQDSNNGSTPKTLLLPPSGFIAGIYARNDISRGVHRAPANLVVRGVTGLEASIGTSDQEVLNPEGINALRTFEGRGHLVWGARTMTSDPEWKYVNVRRLFFFLERSIEVGTQWAVFEPNGPHLWDTVRRSVEAFLTSVWRTGALQGSKAEDAFFVRCDHTTMTQNDLDNGRMICLVGVAPLRPAEFVILRIGQKTADA